LSIPFLLKHGFGHVPGAKVFSSSNICEHFFAGLRASLMYWRRLVGLIWVVPGASGDNVHIKIVEGKRCEIIEK
jgi:hypothetical protein